MPWLGIKGPRAEEGEGFISGQGCEVPMVPGPGPGTRGRGQRGNRRRAGRWARVMCEGSIGRREREARRRGMGEMDASSNGWMICPRGFGDGPAGCAWLGPMAWAKRRIEAWPVVEGWLRADAEMRERISPDWSGETAQYISLVALHPCTCIYLTGHCFTLTLTLTHFTSHTWVTHSHFRKHISVNTLRESKHITIVIIVQR